MRKINLDELYGGSWEWVEESGLCGIKHRSNDLDVKPLKEHLEEWVKIPTDPEKLIFGCLNEKAINYLNDIIEGRVTTLDNDDGVIKFEYDFNKSGEDEESWLSGEDSVVFAPLDIVKKKIMEEARELGIKPHRTWYRDKVDLEALRVTHQPKDNLPF